MIVFALDLLGLGSSSIRKRGASSLPSSLFERVLEKVEERAGFTQGYLPSEVFGGADAANKVGGLPVNEEVVANDFLRY
jgi:hypothetical protein